MGGTNAQLPICRASLPGHHAPPYPRLIPKVSERNAIAEVLTDMDAELAALEERRVKTRSLKQAMMQELLTGKAGLV